MMMNNKGREKRKLLKFYKVKLYNLPGKKGKYDRGKHISLLSFIKYE